MYLFDYQNFKGTTDALNYLIKKYELTVSEFYKKDIYSMLSLYGEFSGGAKFYFKIFEYPKNCSSLIITDTDSLFAHTLSKEFCGKALEFTVELCEVFKYSLLHLTTTRTDLIEYIQTNFQFKEIIRTTNPHSGRINYFMVKEIT